MGPQHVGAASRTLDAVLAATSTVVLACWTFLTGSQWGPEPVLQPTTYRSPSGEYELLVDPSSRHGEGKGSYRMSFRGEELWSRVHPFTFQQAVVADDGSSAGYAYSDGMRGLGKFVVAILGPSGRVRASELVDRTGSRFVHSAPDPRASGVLHQPDADLFVVRVTDPDVNASAETWWTYRMSTGEKLARYAPKEHMKSPDVARWSVASLAVPRTPLVLSSWWCYDNDHGAGARFCLTTPAGGVVWQRDVPGDYELEDDDSEDRLQDEIQSGGAILAVGPGPSFELRFARQSERVTFEVLQGPNGWLVTEEGRRAYEAEPAPPEAALEIQDVELRALGRVSLGKGPVKSSPLRELFTYDVDDRGRIGVVRRPPNRQGHFSFELLDTVGDPLRSFVLEDFPGEPWPGIELCWIEADRWLITRSVYGRQEPSEAFWLDADGGSTRKIEGWDCPFVEELSRAGNGKFVAMVRYQLKYTHEDALFAFDANGAELWRIQPDYSAVAEDERLTCAMDVAVASDASVVVLEGVRNDLKIFSQDGEYLRTVGLAAVLGREPEYPTEVHALAEGGVLVEDKHRYAVLDESFALVRWFQPHYADGSTTGIDTFEVDPHGTWWSHDLGAFLELDEEGKVRRFVGPEPDPDALTVVGEATVDFAGRVYLLDSRTGSVHVFDRGGQALHVCHPRRGDWGDRFEAYWMSVRGDGTLFVGGDGFALEFAPDGTRRRRLLLDELEGDWTFVPGRREHWRHLLDEIELVDGAGRSVRWLERTAENEWLERPLALGVASDGSVAVVDEAGPRIHFYGPAGEPRGSAALPDGGFYYVVAYDGTSAVVVGDATDLLVAVPGGAPLRRFPTGLQSITGLFFSPDGTELWVFQKAEMLGYAIP